MHAYKNDELISKIAALVEQQFGLLVKISSNASGIPIFFIENVTSLEQSNNSLTQSSNSSEQGNDLSAQKENGNGGSRRKRRRNI